MIPYELYIRIRYETTNVYLDLTTMYK